MSNTTKSNRALDKLRPAEIPGYKPKENWKVRLLNKVVVPTIDWSLKLTGGLFILATSLKFVIDWLHANRLNHDFSIVGGILVVSVALYLFVRKR